MHAWRTTHILTLEPRPQKIIWESAFTEKILEINHSVSESQTETMPILRIQKGSFNVTKMVRQLLLNAEPDWYGTTIVVFATGHKLRKMK